MLSHDILRCLFEFGNRLFVALKVWGRPMRGNARLEGRVLDHLRGLLAADASVIRERRLRVLHASVARGVRGESPMVRVPLVDLNLAALYLLARLPKHLLEVHRRVARWRVGRLLRIRVLPSHRPLIGLGLEAREEVVEALEAETDDVPCATEVIVLDQLVAPNLLEGRGEVLVVVQHLGLVGLESVGDAVHLVLELAAVGVLLADALLQVHRRLLDNVGHPRQPLLHPLAHPLLQLVHHRLGLHQHLLLHQLNALRVVVEIVVLVIRSVLNGSIRILKGRRACYRLGNGHHVFKGLVELLHQVALRHLERPLRPLE